MPGQCPNVNVRGEHSDANQRTSSDPKRGWTPAITMIVLRFFAKVSVILAKKDWDDLKINAASFRSNAKNGPKIFGYMLESPALAG